MSLPLFHFPPATPLTVGSIGDLEALKKMSPQSLAAQCDMAEIRLDLFHESYEEIGSLLWQHLLPFPLLFTARSHAEGSPFLLDSSFLTSMLKSALPDACMIDIEASSAQEREDFIAEIKKEKVPWLASFHNFSAIPDESELDAMLKISKEYGASCFKLAARLNSLEDLTTLVHFQMRDCGLPLSTMGMGELGPVSRLLCAQAGSVLNYGYLGEKTTAPGQWSAQQLRAGIQSLTPFR